MNGSVALSYTLRSRLSRMEGRSGCAWQVGKASKNICDPSLKRTTCSTSALPGLLACASLDALATRSLLIAFVLLLSGVILKDVGDKAVACIGGMMMASALIFDLDTWKNHCTFRYL